MAEPPHSNNIEKYRKNSHYPNGLVHTQFYEQPKKKRPKFIQRLSHMPGAGPYDHNVSNWQIKLFFAFVALCLIGLGIWLTIYGSESELRDFLILGPSVLVMGVLLVVFIIINIIKDVCVFNKISQTDHDEQLEQSGI